MSFYWSKHFNKNILISINIVIDFIHFEYSSFNELIVKFYQQSWRSSKSSIASWLSALPVLHYLRRESKPFEDVICDKPINVSDWKWWGLDKLPLREIREHITQRFALVCSQQYRDSYYKLLFSVHFLATFIR